LKKVAKFALSPALFLTAFAIVSALSTSSASAQQAHHTFNSAGIATTAGSDCPHVQFYGVRGSGETSKDGNGYGATVLQFLNSLTASPLGITGVTAKPVDYLAVPVGYDGLYYYLTSTYKNSVTEGENALQSDLITFWHNCPGTPVVLAGYSQGAQVVGDVADSLPRSERAELAAVALFGDPRFNPAQPGVDDPSTGYQSMLKGIYQFANKQMRQVPPDLTSQFRSYCLEGDPVCNYKFRYLATCKLYSFLCTHTMYTDFEVPSDAARWAAGKIRTWQHT
jgi:hypothetical protein